MESTSILILVIGLIVVAVLLAVLTILVMANAFNLINAMNKRVIFLLEKMYEMMGLTTNESIEAFSQAMTNQEHRVNDMLNRKPEEPYNPHKEVETLDL